MNNTNDSNYHVMNYETYKAPENQLVCLGVCELDDSVDIVESDSQEETDWSLIHTTYSISVRWFRQHNGLQS